MFYLELLLIMQGILVILMFIFLRKMNGIKEQIDQITKEVKDYLKFIEEDISQEDKIIKEKQSEKKKEDVQNYIIQSVLKEYFP